jgi:tRNA A37 N6-isopentenylltransferase MiaA
VSAKVNRYVLTFDLVRRGVSNCNHLFDSTSALNIINVMALRPLITICGTTGVGKSKLAVELALKLSNTSSYHGWQGARIINADSMQVYAGMDVITNKITEAEMQGVDHLLMGFKKPGEQYFVGQWVLDAMKAVSTMNLCLRFLIDLVTD